MNLYTRLLQVQMALKAPKGQFNSFGNYNYRSCEDILEAVKPLCKESGLLLTISDKIVEVGGRNYVEATATVIDLETEKSHSVTASAREAATKKGMDDSQITGSTSSYARKYALNGLFNIDDTKDADTPENHNQRNNYNQQQQRPQQQHNQAPPQYNQNQAPPQYQQPPQRPQQEAPQPGNNCTSCGTQIPDNVRKYSINKYGQALCYNCQKKA